MRTKTAAALLGLCALGMTAFVHADAISPFDIDARTVEQGELPVHRYAISGPGRYTDLSDEATYAAWRSRQENSSPPVSLSIEKTRSIRQMARRASSGKQAPVR
jgi:hypothetical protein